MSFITKLNYYASFISMRKVHFRMKRKLFLDFFLKTLADSKIMRKFALAIGNESIQTMVW